MKHKFIPLTNDRMFKAVLTSNEARDYLADIISGITNLPKENIKRDMVFKNTEHPVSGINEKKKISDLVVEIKDNVINLEMNNDYYKGLTDRNFSYIAKLKSNMIGEIYSDIINIIQINFDGFNRYDDERVIIKFEMMDETGVKEGVSVASYHVILPNVRKKYYNKDNKEDLIRKLAILVMERDEELQKLIDENMELRPVGKKMVEITREEELNGIYDKEEHERKVRNSMMVTALEDGWNRGKAEGRAEGIAEGKAEGLKEGLEEGRKEGLDESSKLIAKALLKENIADEIILKTTGISKENLKQLKEK